MRRALAAIAVILGAVACGTPPPTKAPAPSGPPLHLAPATDLAQGAGLSWLIDVEPKALAANAELLPAMDKALPRADLDAFEEKNGFDPRTLDELLVASYAAADGQAMLYLARGALVPGRLEALFRRHAEAVDGRAIDRPEDATGGEVVRTWGTVRGERAQLATFGRELAALEVGRLGPLRVAELFAQGKLKRASPALKVGALARAAELVGEAPARGFALGPFEGESAKGLGGLLAASTAAGVAAQPIVIGDRGALKVVLVLTGGWGASAGPAAERLRIAFEALAATGLGRLSGLGRPLEPARVEALPDALRLTVGLDALELAKGARALMGAEVSEIMSN